MNLGFTLNICVQTLSVFTEKTAENVNIVMIVCSIRFVNGSLSFFGICLCAREHD